MPTLLRIDSSTRVEGSHTRALGDQAQAAWLAANPAGTVITRNTPDGSIPYLSQDTIAGFFTPPDDQTPEMKEATALSDQLIAELHSADLLLITAPLYNFGVPAALKAWIDLVTRMGHTFSYEDGAFKGLTQTKRAIVVCGYGSGDYLQGQPKEAANFLEPYLRFLLGFIGIEDVQVVSVQSTTADADTVTRNMDQARADLALMI
ncbi:NAD(P)H-dependent oxidoreductase [uncultured Litoreibacter sp.]|uniref:FMN-dependent NADH-azoreductase n=1 Tax=uncultured Litoreibacter sp. TaxID=1392394 RepID=UPI002624CA89|nr:NAD(P)H-dependent oxidoreductase [uncultured Litoreibacter sp.]